MKKNHLIALVVGIWAMASLPTIAQFNKNVKTTKEPVKTDISLTATELAGMVNGTDYTVVNTITKTGPLDDYVFGSSGSAQYRVRYDPSWAYDTYVGINKQASSACYSGPYGDCTLSKALTGYVSFYSFAPCTVYLNFKYMKPDYLLTGVKNGNLFNPTQANPTEDFDQYMVVRDKVGFNIMKFNK